MPELEQVLEQLQKHARPAILKLGIKPDSCVPMTAVAIEVLGHFGFPADPMYAECIIVNKKLRELADAGKVDLHGRIPQWAEDEGAWAIGLGVIGSIPDMVVGHVVAVCRDYMIDLSIDQATRPAKNIFLEPAIYQLTEGTEGIYIFEQGEIMLSYRLHPELQTWKKSPDWTQFKSRYGPTTGQIIRTIKKELE